MLRIFDVNYDLLSSNRSHELFTLRKKTFKDRLDWLVNCENNMEFDEYDNNNTTYLFGIYDNQVVCSIRFIEIKHHNMITGTFNSYFNDLKLPEGNFVDASRLFIDKERARSSALNHKPVSTMIFLAMINYARHRHYEGIYAIVSHPMWIIFKRSGWRISVVQQGMSEKNERIYLIFMPVDQKNQQILIERISQASPAPAPAHPMQGWPLTFTVRDNRTNQLQLNAQTYSMSGIGNT